MRTYNQRTGQLESKLDSWDGTCTDNSVGCGGGTNYSEGASILNASNTVCTYPDDCVATSRTPNLKTGVKWGKVLRSNGVIMTPYYNKTINTRYYITAYPQIANLQIRLCSKLLKSGVFAQGTCAITCGAKATQEAMSTYERWTDYSELQANNTACYTTNQIANADILSAVANTRLQAAAKSYKDYDALTEALQMKQTVGFFTESAKSGAGLLSKFYSRFSIFDLKLAAGLSVRELKASPVRALRAIGNAWLAYRYSLMPIIYSLTDIVKAVSRSALFSSRSSMTVTPSSTGVSLPTGSTYGYCKLYTTGSVKVTSTVTTKYLSDTEARLDRISANLFSTLWEFLPYSFVADWIVNVSDNITTIFSNSFAEEVGCCTAIRTKKYENLSYCWKVNQDLSVTPTRSFGATLCWPSTPQTVHRYNAAEGEGIVRTVEYDMYERSLFNRAQTSNWSLNPTINWKRITDAMFLAIRPLTALGVFTKGTVKPKLPDPEISPMAKSIIDAYWAKRPKGR